MKFIDSVQRFLSGTSDVVAKSIFERLSATVVLPAVTKFVASENFVVDTSKKAKLRISELGKNFKANFLQKVEGDEVAAEELAVYKLLKRSYDPAIITALGGEAKVEITLGQFFAVFAKQPNDEAGALLTNGNANVGYVRDINGVLWAVYGIWFDDGWTFESASIAVPRYWLDGFQFLSH